MASTLVSACGQRPQSDDVAALELDPTLGRRFDAAVVGLQVAKADPPGSSLRWQTPSCELEYQFLVTLDIELVGEDSKMPSSGLRIAGGWTAHAGDSRMLLRNRELILSHVQAGIQRPGNAQPAGTLAEIRLETDGRTWSEVDGPTSLWSAYGSWAGLVLFHPAIPERTTLGAQGDWPLLLLDRGAGVRVEVERGSFEVPEGYELVEPSSQTIPARVELQRWIDIGGTRAAVLRARYGLDADSPFIGGSLLGSLDADKTSEAQYVVLDSGVLLHAELQERTKLKMRVGLGKSMQQLHTLDAEARLIRGCGGPVLPSFPDEHTPAELALELAVALRQHASVGELEPLAALLDPELRAAHPDAARCLVETMKLFGWRALGTPELPMGDDVRTDGPRVMLRLPVRMSIDGEDVSGEVELTVMVEGTEARLAALSLTRFGDLGPLLHLRASQELIAAAACTELDPPPESDPLFDDTDL
jgi:hypothetical protein